MLKLSQKTAALNRSLPYYQNRNGRLTQLGGQIGTIVGIASRLAPLAFKTYGRYLMKGGMFGVLATMGEPAKAKETAPETHSIETMLAKSALLGQLYNIYKTSKPGTRAAGLRSALVLAGVQKALPIVADYATKILDKRRAARKS